MSGTSRTEPRSSMASSVTPLILTFNETPNIERTLARLNWAERIVIVDSFSSDGTAELLANYPKVELFQRRFDDHSSQWNFGLDQVRTPWVLSLDADYVLSEGFVEELLELSPASDASYEAAFNICVFGRRLRASLYPPRTVLFKAEGSRYYQDGHTQRLRTNAPLARLRSLIQHDDRKSLGQWLTAQDRYARLEATKLASAEELPVQDRLRKLILPAPPIVFFYTLFIKGMIWEGWPGWYYVLQRTVAETILSLRLIESRLLGE